MITGGREGRENTGGKEEGARGGRGREEERRERERQGRGGSRWGGRGRGERGRSRRVLVGGREGAGGKHWPVARNSLLSVLGEPSATEVCPGPAAIVCK